MKANALMIVKYLLNYARISIYIYKIGYNLKVPTDRKITSLTLLS